ncbi:MAG: SH3 domain-containing protein, partial [Paludibacter sp.]|nr:SH3 domain-containing protein [Paludibacter sp.]
MFAINFLPLVPMRAADSERSEMISQLLYGETVTILESTDRWLFVENTADQYRGWVDKKMLKLLDDQEYASILTHGVQTLYYPLLECENNNTFEKMYLPGG